MLGHIDASCRLGGRPEGRMASTTTIPTSATRVDPGYPLPEGGRDASELRAAAVVDGDSRDPVGIVGPEDVPCREDRAYSVLRPAGR